MRMRWLGWLGLVALVALGACSTQDSRRPMFHDDAEDMPEFSKSRLGDSENSSVADFLTDEEREAVRRQGWVGWDDGALADDEEAGGAAAAKDKRDEGTLDKAGKVMVALLGVGVTLGAAAAPYLLF